MVYEFLRPQAARVSSNGCIVGLLSFMKRWTRMVSIVEPRPTARRSTVFFGICRPSDFVKAIWQDYVQIASKPMLVTGGHAEETGGL